ncbi:aldo/keto reductase [Asticcacaulis sp. DW145]|uniref:Aldo/keto reductase n=1 Tax=Asticcacaulis currens TaxID=2984210 RepID=A0ABT5IAK8_9CAUL|nr:aldo/keto reductase [Asticcacaulis currens]MDC7692920.1 aldo/keto reductase [Asticcacaulis currens]BEV11722.1 aldo/keto reductase [Asticcacaulis sp. DW145]
MKAALGLGSAQFGCDYGISNLRGRVSEDEVRQILSYAAQCGLKAIDVAPYEGDVERILGRCWPFPSPFKPQIRTVRAERGLDWVESRLKRSVEHMGLARVGVGMIDDASDLMGPQGDALWARMEKLKADGLFSRIGISARYEDSPVALAKRFKPDLIQVPTSILDQRLVREGALETLSGMGIEVQVRSVFLQGLLFTPREALPANLQPLGPQLSRIRRHLLETATDPLHAALSYALNLKGVSSVIVGVTSAAELRAVIAASDRPRPDLAWQAFAIEDPIALNPALWHADLSEDPRLRERRSLICAA